MNDEFLKNHQKPPRPEFSEALYRRISAMSPDTSPKRTGYRPALAFLALALALILLFTVSPQAQAYVESFMRQIGIISISNEERPETELNPNTDPAPLPDPTSTPIPLDHPSEWTSVDQLAIELSFRPLQPTYLPEGYTLDTMYPMEYLSDDQQSQGWGSALSYKPASGAEHFLEVQQSKFTTQDIQQFPVGGAPITDVTVRSHAGVWVEQISLDPQSPLWNAVNLLMWEEDGFVFALFSDDLPLEEMLKVAEALK